MKTIKTFRIGWIVMPLALLILLPGCATNSAPQTVAPSVKLPPPDARWMRTPNLPQSCATWSECAQKDIESWRKRLIGYEVL